MELGAVLLEKFPNLTVDVKNPEVTVTVEIRDTNAYVHAENIKGADFDDCQRDDNRWICSTNRNR
jgi:adenylyl- and sulfurtransferase ThiI